jgi:hypothetical protein
MVVERLNHANLRTVPEANGRVAIYTSLAQHQRDEEWFGRELIAVLQDWADIFIVEFKLDIDRVVLCLEALSKNCYAHFRPGHNGFGLQGEIAFNTLYLMNERELWELLGTLLHELLHAWQDVHGKPGKKNHHNLEFRTKAWDLGLIVDRRGVTGYQAASPFKTLLGIRGIGTPDKQVFPKTRKPKARSKLKKWCCGCRPAINVRVAIANFHARCLDCGCEFERQED